MRNRAKCASCDDIIESFHRSDYAECSCKSISVYGGIDEYKCAAKNWASFIRIDDDGREIPVQVKESIVDEKKAVSEYVSDKIGPSKQDLLDSLRHMAKEWENLPDQAMRQPVDRYDFCRLASLVFALLNN